MPDETPPLYDVHDVADLFDVDPETVRRWIRDGDLEASKLGKGYHVSRPDLEELYQRRGGGQLFDDGGEGIRERISLLRQSIRASLEGDHDRAASILDTLEEGETDG